MFANSMPKLRREAEALGANAVALAEACSSASRQRAGAFGLSAGVALDLRRLSDEGPHLPILMCLSLSLDCNTPTLTIRQNCGSRAIVICSLHAVQQDCVCVVLLVRVSILSCRMSVFHEHEHDDHHIATRINSTRQRVGFATGSSWTLWHTGGSRQDHGTPVPEREGRGWPDKSETKVTASLS